MAGVGWLVWDGRCGMADGIPDGFCAALVSVSNVQCPAQVSDPLSDALMPTRSKPTGAGTGRFELERQHAPTAN
eukprot:330570-Chlamydomonas_euryale.AAC.2